MAADPSQNSLLVDLPTDTDISNAIAGNSSTGLSLVPNGVNSSGHTFLSDYEQDITETFVARTAEGVATTDCEFIPPSRYYFDSENYLRFRGDFKMNDTFYHGACHAPAVVLRGRSVVVSNPNAATIYWRKGTANADGVTIAKPGDTNGDNVQGTPLYAYERLVLTRGVDYEEGEYLHLLGTAAAQTATIQLL